MRTTIVLTIEHDKPIADLLDKVAGRAYTISGVSDVTATLPDRLSDMLELPVIDMKPSDLPVLDAPQPYSLDGSKLAAVVFGRRE